VEDLAIEADTMRRELADLASRHEELSASGAAIDAHLVELDRRGVQATVRSDLERLEATMHRLQQQRDHLEREIDELRKDLSALRGRQAHAEYARAQVPADTKVGADRIASDPARLGFDQDRLVAGIRDEAARMRSKLYGLTFERDHLQSNLSALEGQVRDLEAQQARGDAERAQAQAELEVLGVVASDNEASPTALALEPDASHETLEPVRAETGHARGATLRILQTARSGRGEARADSNRSRSRGGSHSHGGRGCRAPTSR